MNKNVPNSRPFFRGAKILGLPSFGPKIYTQLHKRIHIPWATRTVNPLLSPPRPAPPPPSLISPTLSGEEG